MERLADAKRLVRRFVQDGAEEQVNLPHSMVKVIEKAIKEAGSGGDPVPPTLFEAAEKEVFQLMDRNAYHRFRADPDSVQAVCEEFFAKADLEQVRYKRSTALHACNALHALHTLHTLRLASVTDRYQPLPSVTSRLPPLPPVFHCLPPLPTVTRRTGSSRSWSTRRGSCSGQR